MNLKRILEVVKFKFKSKMKQTSQFVLSKYFDIISVILLLMMESLFNYNMFDYSLHV